LPPAPAPEISTLPPPPEAAPLPPPNAAVPENGKVKIALLLPLSGPSAALGNAMLDAAMMGLYDAPEDRIELVPHDTAGTPQGATDAARAALADGARLIIGPLLAAEVEAVKPMAKDANVPVLAFSTVTSLAGDGTYLMSFLPGQEISRVVAFAHSKGVDHFAILAPGNAYGDVATQAMRDAVTASQASLDVIGTDDPGSSDLAGIAKRFAGNGTNYQGLLLPEGANRVKALAPVLAYYDVDPEKIHFLGTGLWDDPSLGTEPNLVNSWYAAPPPTDRAAFEKRFRDAEGRAPPRLATLAYDATALAAALARGPNGPDYSPAALTNPSGFVGLDGAFRFHADGLVERALAVLEVHREGPRVVDPASDSFQTVPTE